METKIDYSKFRIYSEMTGEIIFDRYNPIDPKYAFSTMSDTGTLRSYHNGAFKDIPDYVKDSFYNSLQLWQTIDTGLKYETLKTDTYIDVYENDIIRLGYYICHVKRSSNSFIGEYIEDGKVNYFDFKFSGDLPVFMGKLGNAHDFKHPEFKTVCDAISFKYQKQWKKVKYIDWSTIDLTTVNFDDIGFKFQDEFDVHLVKQEIDMYKSIAKEVSQDDLMFISNRRGFDINKINFIIRQLKDAGIGNQLEYLTEHPSKE